MVILVIAFLRGKYQDFSISNQQAFILSYAKENGIAIEVTELDNSSYSSSLEEREPFLDLLRSLNPDDTILVYNLYSLSKKVGELTKIFDCIFKHNINVHICYENIVINKDTSASFMMGMLSSVREANKTSQNISIGRPKGSFSKSKFDVYKQEIVKMLEESLSVSEIAKRLGVSRSSLKDYINSRSLKEIANLQGLPSGSFINLNVIEDDKPKTCPLTDN